MSYALVKYDFPGGNVKPLCEYAIETASDLTSLPATDISPNSVAITPNGALYRLSVSGDWVFDTSTYGAPTYWVNCHRLESVARIINACSKNQLTSK